MPFRRKNIRPCYFTEQEFREHIVTTAKTGDKVTVHYTGKLADGSIFDSSIGEDPLVFTLGDEEFIEGFEEGILGMAAGEKQTVTFPPEKGYGHRDDEMVITLPRADLQTDFEIAVGDELELTSDDDETFIAAVIELNDATVTLDENPPLAGETLTFELELVAIG